MSPIDFLKGTISNWARNLNDAVLMALGGFFVILLICLIGCSYGAVGWVRERGWGVIASLATAAVSLIFGAALAGIIAEIWFKDYAFLITYFRMAFEGCWLIVLLSEALRRSFAVVAACVLVVYCVICIGGHTFLSKYSGLNLVLDGALSILACGTAVFVYTRLCKGRNS